ncbi:alpha/beta hydrolase [Streptosporangium sp. NPDC051022]|uniref:alpha/beta hydrolase family protein n=1 Tax=Streptosporangium sp. NPDC051022 TaxID=3155752 RepID=UPI003416DC68
MPTSVLRGALAAAIALLTFATPAAAEVPAVRGATLGLSRPTGPHQVGTTTLHLVDDSRPDPWVPEERARELMVSLWYPSRASHGRRAPYMTPEESSLLLEGQGVDGVPGEVLSGTRTNAFVDAPPLGHGLPLVVLSPGFTLPRSSLTALAEDLASRGYVVAGIDHTYESFGTALPGGRTATCVACQSWGSPEFGDRTTRGRAADVSFVIDRLTGPRPAWRYSGLIDPSRIGMAGHSIGGNSATWTMLGDPRVRAGINMDGTFHIPVPDGGLSRPFMLMGAGKIHEPGGRDTTWGRDWLRMTGWKRWLTVDGMDHTSFTDYPLFAGRLGVDTGASISGPRAVAITREYVGAFFDLHLRGRSRPLLDGPSRRFPEARFWP